MVLQVGRPLREGSPAAWPGSFEICCTCPLIGSSRETCCLPRRVRPAARACMGRNRLHDNRCAVPKHPPCTGYSMLHRVYPNNPPRYIDICTCSVGRPPPIATAALASPLHLTRGVEGRRKLGQRDTTVLDELQRCRGHALCTVRLHSASNDAQSGKYLT